MFDTAGTAYHLKFISANHSYLLIEPEISQNVQWILKTQPNLAQKTALILQYESIAVRMRDESY